MGRPLVTFGSVKSTPRPALTGSLLRPEGHEWFRKGSDYRVKTDVSVFCDGAGDIHAYAARDVAKEAVTIVEEAGLFGR